ncbi:helix-turn-helix domain-containing protein [Clostridium perfringens]|uniref:helix-turn-helix domain-containing protein n=2 Tax=Clostridium perfringens TaxID=1502 RepID=UPI0024499862|nr:helix-turn-helix transcriptional regulator [Clostridium perfringens]MDH2340587.1 helix-turn-helix transcriptional regulator [Clostridium perfringens]
MRYESEEFKMEQDIVAELRRLRKIKKIRMDELASYIGITKSAISQFESYKINLKEEHLQKYREYVTNNKNI